jgi:hypothetical protein
MGGKGFATDASAIKTEPPMKYPVFNIIGQKRTLASA